MEELLRQISIPDSIGASLTGLLFAVAGFILRRQNAIQKMQREMARIAEREAIRGMCVLRIQRITVQNHLTPEERERAVETAYDEALERLADERNKP